MSYVTGTHHVKVGIQDTFGRYRRTDGSNGDIRAVFINGVATTANVLNSPVERRDLLHADAGLFAQDSWTLKRMTVNYGARYEHFERHSAGSARPAATAARTFGPIEMPTWNSIARAAASSTTSR
jgi:hypothetical protein